MDFISMGDKNYFDTIELSIDQVNKLYPGSKFVFYDWGLGAEQIARLKKKKVTIVDWRDRLLNAEVLMPKKDYKYFIRKYLLMHPDHKRPLKEWQIEFLYAEKTYCILDAVTKTDRGVVYLDGDAFIVNTLEEVIDDPCDIAVTLRSLEEVEAAKMRGSIHELNAGVMFFKGSREKNVAFITEWIKEMHILNLKRVGLSEQTALSNLIKKYNKDAFRTYFQTVNILIGGYQINCKIFPCENYNYNFVENGFDPKINKILHLKSNRGLNKKVLRDIKNKLSAIE